MISSRRKSCSACARGKRRCDLGFPQCGRCLAKRVTCVYAWITPQEAQEVVRATEAISPTPQERVDQGCGLNVTFETPQSGHEGLGLTGSQANNEMTFSPAPLTLTPDLVPLVNEITGGGRTISILAPGPQLQVSDKPYLNPGTEMLAPQYPSTIDILSVSAQRANANPIYTEDILRERVEYAASRLIHQVKTLAETGQTSFIHHTQTNHSAILRESFVVSSFSMTRGLGNEWLIRSEISRRARLLIEATETAISLMPPNSDLSLGLDLLPAIQAMLIYQCMRLFSPGDVAQQTQAEADGKLLARWINILHEQTQWSLSSATEGNHLNVSVWKDWVYVESTKRTLIFAEMLDGIYSYLRFGWYQPSGRPANLSFSGQAAIWEAKTSADWEQARMQKLWLELNMSSFRDGLKVAFPDDVDELGVIILASYDGLDALKKWARNDERLLEKWGLTSR